jgi:hypothetical protein
LHCVAGINGRYDGGEESFAKCVLTLNAGKCWRSSGMLVREKGAYATDNSFADVLLRRCLASFTA